MNDDLYLNLQVKEKVHLWPIKCISAIFALNRDLFFPRWLKTWRLTNTQVSQVPLVFFLHFFFILIIRYVTFGLTIVLLSRLSGIPSVILHVVHILLPLWSIQKLYYTTNSKSIGNIIMSVPNLHTNAQVATRRSVGFRKVFSLFIYFFGKGVCGGLNI